MIANFAEGAMVAFIVAIIIAGFFGPWVISLMLGAVCLGCIGMRRMSGGGES
jgi:hypothetical protein